MSPSPTQFAIALAVVVVLGCAFTAGLYFAGKKLIDLYFDRRESIIKKFETEDKSEHREEL